jgi:dTDP-4-amino-4,6-dideoxygalactose transaminase
MEPLVEIAEEFGLYIIEDTAHGIDSFYKGRPLGSIGHLAAFSFHETKNIISGEGGLLVINEPDFQERAEIIWEKGTNRAQFFRGEVDKYSWIDLGSSFMPADIVAAFLYAQLENLDRLQNKRLSIWNRYYEEFHGLEEQQKVRLPFIPSYSSNNGSFFYMVCRDLKERTALIEHLKSRGILAVFHYLPLHKSPFYREKHDGRDLPHAEMFSDCLVRLPFYYGLTEAEQDSIIEAVIHFYR